VKQSPYGMSVIVWELSNTKWSPACRQNLRACTHTDVPHNVQAHGCGSTQRCTLCGVQLYSVVCSCARLQQAASEADRSHCRPSSWHPATFMRGMAIRPRTRLWCATSGYDVPVDGLGEDACARHCACAGHTHVHCCLVNDDEGGDGALSGLSRHVDTVPWTALLPGR